MEATPEFVAEDRALLLLEVENSITPRKLLGPRRIALNVPESEKKDPFPKGFPFLLEAPAWTSEPVAKNAMSERKAKNKGEEERIN